MFKTYVTIVSIFFDKNHAIGMIAFGMIGMITLALKVWLELRLGKSFTSKIVHIRCSYSFVCFCNCAADAPL